MEQITAYKTTSGKIFESKAAAKKDELQREYIELLTEFGIQWNSKKGEWVVKQFFHHLRPQDPFRFARKIRKLQKEYQKIHATPPYDDIPF